MKDRATGNPRGFGFVTYADPSVVDKVIKDKHVIDGKMVSSRVTFPYDIRSLLENLMPSISIVIFIY